MKITKKSGCRLGSNSINGAAFVAEGVLELLGLMYRMHLLMDLGPKWALYQQQSTSAAVTAACWGSTLTGLASCMLPPGP